MPDLGAPAILKNEFSFVASIRCGAIVEFVISSWDSPVGLGWVSYEEFSKIALEDRVCAIGLQMPMDVSVLHCPGCVVLSIQ